MEIKPFDSLYEEHIFYKKYAEHRDSLGSSYRVLLRAKTNLSSKAMICEAQKKHEKFIKSWSEKDKSYENVKNLLNEGRYSFIDANNAHNFGNRFYESASDSSLKIDPDMYDKLEEQYKTEYKKLLSSPIDFCYIIENNEDHKRICHAMAETLCNKRDKLIDKANNFWEKAHNIYHKTDEEPNPENRYSFVENRNSIKANSLS